jgi:hypothetical protein
MKAIRSIWQSQSGLAAFLLATTAAAHHPGFAPCLANNDPTANPPSGNVVVRILSIEPNTDLEGDDDAIPFYDNHADIYGKVVINGESRDLPKINEDDHPHWDGHPPDATHPNGGVFTVVVPATPDPMGLTPLPVPISIQISESDGGLTGDDDTVDINPLAAKSSLDFNFDMCSFRIDGDINANGTQAAFEVSGGNGDDAASIRFTVGLADGRPVSLNDAALTDLDFVQVTPRVGRLVAGKPTVLMARVVNNYPTPINTKIEVRIAGLPSGNIVDEFQLGSMGGGEVKTFYLYENDPLVFPESGQPYTAHLTGILDPDGQLADTGHSVPQDCRAQNNGRNNRFAWRIVETRGPSVLWAKVGMDLDLLNFAPDSHFNEIIELGEGYIRGTYPIASLDQSTSPIDLPVMITPGFDWLRAIIPGTDSADPFLMVAELGGMAAILGYDRILGVLPNKDWFERFEGWSSVTGLSLGDALPRVVIFLPRKENDADVGPALALPAHELGHTYGLSVDSAIKPKWACGTDLGPLTTLICGMNKGFDEYTNETPPFDQGNPGNGYWITQGGESAAFSTLFGEQCDSHCFMGSTNINAHDHWSSHKSWIDPSDYDRLLDQLIVGGTAASLPAPASVNGGLVYVSGLIALKGDYELDDARYEVKQNEFGFIDVIHTPATYRMEADPVPVGKETIGKIRFIGAGQKVLATADIPVRFLIVNEENGAAARAAPVSAFGLTIPMPPGTQEIAVDAHGEDGGYVRLGSRKVSLSVPEVKLAGVRVQKSGKGRALAATWQGYDADSDALRYTVAVSPDRGQHWWPLGVDLDKSSQEFDLRQLPRGTYAVRVIAHDGVHIGVSPIELIRVN